VPVRCSRYDFHLSTTSECVQIAGKEDFRELFLKPFFFGCEADDPVTASAFDTLRNPFICALSEQYAQLAGDLYDGIAAQVCWGLQHSFLFHGLGSFRLLRGV
jgi:hypothetical protein